MPFLLIESKDSPVFPEAMEPNCFASCKALRKRVMVNLEHAQLQASETEMGRKIGMGEGIYLRTSHRLELHKVK